jgi:hypothetical protein
MLLCKGIHWQILATDGVELGLFFSFSDCVRAFVFVSVHILLTASPFLSFFSHL